MFKPLTADLDARSKRLHNGTVDPGLIARSFGVVYQPNQPLPEADVPLVHVEDERPSRVLIDERKLPKPRVTPLSLVAIAIRRLQSLKPHSPVRKREVAAAIASAGELKAIDDLVATLEAEHFAAIESRHEELRKQGRTLLETLPGIQGELNMAMMACNESAAVKSQCVVNVRAAHEESRKISRWATEKEINAADVKLAKSREQMQLASDKALEDMRSMAVVEGRLATARANLASVETEMDRLEAEASGKPYHDPETGLSIDPTRHRDGW